MNLSTLAASVFILNLPFGVLRARSRRFSRKWFIYIHAPIPLVIVLRVYSGLGFKLSTFPPIIGAFFLGQFTGTIFHKLSSYLKKRKSQT